MNTNSPIFYTYSGVDFKDVLIICATNCPDKFDFAMRRRFPTKIYIPLPGPDVRSNIFKSVLSKMSGIKNDVTGEQYVALGENTAYYSCDDIKNVLGEVVSKKRRTFLKKCFIYSAERKLRPCESTDLCQGWSVLLSTMFNK